MSAVGLILTIFVVILIYMIFRYMFYSTNTLTSVQSGKTASIIPASQLPNTTSGTAATNFTYSAWINIDNWNYRYGQPKVILGRMSGKSSDGSGSGIEGIYGANPCPVLALGAVENTATCALACYGGLQDTGSTISTDISGNQSKTAIHTCMIGNVPLQSWVHLAIVVNNLTMDFYMNGKIVRTCLLPGPAAIDSSADLYITPNGGFEGYTANIQYWAAPKNPQEIWNIYQKGYSSSLFGSMFNTYSLQVSVTENGVTQGSVSI
jgi:hypothetical protein